MSGAYSPGPGTSAPRAEMPSEVRRALVPKPPVPDCKLLLNDLLTLPAIEFTLAVLYDCAPGPSVTGWAVRCDDLEAKAADDLLLASPALAKAPVILDVS